MLALAAIGERELAEAELRRLSALAPSDLLPELAAMAQALDLPAASAPEAAPRVARAAGSSCRSPVWKPAGGYKLDRHLIHAVIRAESGFDPGRAQPQRRARADADHARYRARPRQGHAGSPTPARTGCSYPPNNMAVGQAWLQQLGGTSTVQGNLIHLLAAYNAGEGRVAGWLGERASRAAEDDPLLFVESVPLAETRGYIKKVLASLWAYQASQGERSPSLTALAENRWPEWRLPATRRQSPRPRLVPGRIDESRAFQPLRIAVLTVSDTRTAGRRSLGRHLGRARIEAAGHELVGPGHRQGRSRRHRRPSCGPGSLRPRSRS